MRSLPAGAQAALDARAITLRDFIWLVARDRSDDSAVSVGYWSDVGTVSAQVVNPMTGGTVSRTFAGAGGLISVSQVPMTANLTVQTVTVSVSQVSDANDLIRAYDVKQARIEIFRGLFTPAMVQLAPAFPRFVGFVDEVQITTPAEGGDGSIDMTCVSHAQEMSRFNPATRSDADLRKRDPDDTFRRHAASVGTWEVTWGD